MSDDRETRTQEHTLEIEAPPEAVWRALTEAEQITRWFAPEAEVEPGEGGEIWMSWGPGMGGAGRIHIWEPHRRFGWTEERPGRESEDGASGPIEMTVTIEIEGDGGRTTLRLVHAGFGTGADWEDEYESTETGWQLFLGALKHMLERHRDDACHNILLSRATDQSITAAWAQLLGPNGLGAADVLDETVVDQHYTARTATGRDISGTLELYAPPTRPDPTYVELASRVPQLGDALMWWMVFGDEEGARVTLGLTTYGLTDDEAAAVREDFDALLETAFPDARPVVADA